MRIDLSRVFKDFEGKEILTEDGKKFVLKEVMGRALLADFKDEVELVGEEKVKRYQLAMKIMNEETSVEITIEDLALVKKLLAKMYGVLITAQAWEMLEGSR